MAHRDPTVLVIDDQEVNLRLMRAYLRAENSFAGHCDWADCAISLVAPGSYVGH